VTPAERFVFSNRGASLRHATLLEPKFRPRKGEEGTHANGIDLVHPTEAKAAPLRISFPSSAFPTPPDTAWRLVEGRPLPPGAAQQLIYRAETPTLIIEKRFLWDASRYRMHLDVTVENRASAPADHHLTIQVPGYQDPDAKGGFFSGASSNTSSVLCHVADKTKREPIEKFYEALTAAGNKPEAHIYRAGEHGFGMKKQGTTSDHWMEEFYWWLESQGLTKPAK